MVLTNIGSLSRASNTRTDPIRAKRNRGEIQTGGIDSHPSLLRNWTRSPERRRVDARSARPPFQTCQLLEFVLVSELHVILVRAQPGRYDTIPLDGVAGALQEPSGDFLGHSG